jgi:hypothetical protein
VALGYGRFHSSYLPRALRAADEAEIDPLRLIVALGQRDTMRLPEGLLRETVEQLRGTSRPSRREDLAVFSDERFGPRRIGNRPGAVIELLDDLDVVAAKRHLKVVLDLTLSSALDEQSVSAEFLLEDSFAAVGRVRAGSTGALATELEPLGSRAELLLLDADGIGPDRLHEVVGALERVSSASIAVYRSGDLIARLLGDVALALVGTLAPARITLADPGWLASEDSDALAGRLAQIAPLSRTQATLGEEPSALCVVAGPVLSVRSDDEPNAWPAVVGMGPGPAPRWAPNAILLAPADAYRDRVPGWLAAARVSASTRQLAGART